MLSHLIHAVDAHMGQGRPQVGVRQNIILRYPCLDLRTAARSIPLCVVAIRSQRPKGIYRPVCSQNKWPYYTCIVCNLVNWETDS